MKAEVVYDGRYQERRLYAVRNLLKLVTDDRLVSMSEELEKAIKFKERFKREAININPPTRLYFDVKLGGKMYKVLAVGDYGIGVVGDTDNRVFSATHRIHEIKEAGDINKLKIPWFGHPIEDYDRMVKDNKEEATVTDIVSSHVKMDYETFATSELWKDLEERRNVLAEQAGAEPYMIYKLHDVYDLLCLCPSEPSPTCPIEPRYQEVILSDWRNYILSGYS